MISGSILDRKNLHIEVPAVRNVDYRSTQPAENRTHQEVE